MGSEEKNLLKKKEKNFNNIKSKDQNNQNMVLFMG